MKSFKNKNGITLIALIITIIVMIILVAVTVSVALNGGIFQKAEEGTKSTMIATEKEQLIAELANQRAVQNFKGFDDSSVLNDVATALGEGWSYIGENKFKAPSENVYKVEGGKVTGPEGGNNPETEDDIAGSYLAQGTDLYVFDSEGNMSYYEDGEGEADISEYTYDSQTKAVTFWGNEYKFYSLNNNKIILGNNEMLSTNGTVGAGLDSLTGCKFKDGDENEYVFGVNGGNYTVVSESFVDERDGIDNIGYYVFLDSQIFILTDVPHGNVEAYNVVYEQGTEKILQLVSENRTLTLQEE